MTRSGWFQYAFVWLTFVSGDEDFCFEFCETENLFTMWIIQWHELIPEVNHKTTHLLLHLTIQIIQISKIIQNSYTVKQNGVTVLGVYWCMRINSRVKYYLEQRHCLHFYFLLTNFSVSSHSFSVIFHGQLVIYRTICESYLARIIRDTLPVDNSTKLEMKKNRTY